MDVVGACVPTGRHARACQVALCGTRARLHADDVAAEFARFVTVGVISSLVYFAAFLALRRIGTQPANLVALVASSVLANELHRRVTFHPRGRGAWVSAPFEGGGVAPAGPLCSTASPAPAD